MPSFSSAPVATVLPKAKAQNTGVRIAAFNAVLDQVRSTILDQTPNAPDAVALTVQLEEGDKALTLTNQIRRAATQLGITVNVRRRGQVISAYKTGVLETPAPAPAKRGPKSKKVA